MCMAIPSRITAIDGDMATVECFGASRVVSLMLLPEPAELGDYVIIQAGGFAMDKVDPADAAETLAYMAKVLAGTAEADSPA